MRMRIWQVGPRTSCWVILEWRQIVPVQEDQERWTRGGGGGLGLNTRGVRIIHAPGHVQVLSKLNGFVGRKKIYLVLRVEG